MKRLLLAAIFALAATPALAAGLPVELKSFVLIEDEVVHLGDLWDNLGDKADTVLAGMDGRELIMVLGLAVLLILLGVYPQPFLDTSAATMSGVQQWLGSAFTQLASAR